MYFYKYIFLPEKFCKNIFLYHKSSTKMQFCRNIFLPEKFYRYIYPRQQKWSGPDLAQIGVKVWPRPGNLAWASPGVNHGPDPFQAWQNGSMPWAYHSDARPLTMACHGLTRPGLAKRIDTMPLPDQAWQTGSIPWFYQAVTMVLPGAYQTRPTKNS